MLKITKIYHMIKSLFFKLIIFASVILLDACSSIFQGFSYVLATSRRGRDSKANVSQSWQL